MSAPLADTPEEYEKTVETADNWVQELLDTKKMKAAGEPVGAVMRGKVRTGQQELSGAGSSRCCPRAFVLQALTAGSKSAEERTRAT